MLQVERNSSFSTHHGQMRKDPPFSRRAKRGTLSCHSQDSQSCQVGVHVGRYSFYLAVGEKPGRRAERDNVDLDDTGTNLSLFAEVDSIR